MTNHPKDPRRECERLARENLRLRDQLEFCRQQVATLTATVKRLRESRKADREKYEDKLAEKEAVINELKDVDTMLNAGADKVSINSAALRCPSLIDDIANHFGSQVCIVAIDARFEDDGEWHCYLNGGRLRTDKCLAEWAKEAADRGAGEILFTSMNHDS